jgi:2-keto-4-pentenoate hydratase/2-oxohepta-3-ene-1,7-dioic acid hydratase in catechol pathway
MSVPRKQSYGADKAGAAPFTGDFALGTFALRDRKALPAMVMGTQVVALALVHRAYADSAHGTCLRPGDIVETGVQGLGRQQNRVVGPEENF